MVEKVGNIPLSDSELIRETKEQREKARLMNEALGKLLNQTMVPKDQNKTYKLIDNDQTPMPWGTSVNQGDPGRFASPMPLEKQKNSWQELDEHSKRLIAMEKGGQL